MDEQLLQVLQNQQALLEALAEKSAGVQLNAGYHQKVPAQFRTANPLHGSSGLFSTPGLERDIITAHIRPYGIGASLPLIPSVYQDPRFGSITGFTAPVGNQPVHACDDAPYAYMKGCNLTARFGRIRYDTNTIDINEVMLKLHRGDFTDLRLRGQLLGMTDIGPKNIDQGQVLNVMTAAEMVTVGVLFERELSRQIWQGSFLIANEFPGLDVQIATGQRDADTNALCTALDSDVKNFNYRMIETNCNLMVTYLSMLEAYLHTNAERMGLMPVQWIIAIRPELWEQLTACWPCAYNTNKCASQSETGATTVIDGREMVTLSDAMRNGLFIDINGRRYPVIKDVGIFEHNNVNNEHLLPGQYASSIYMVPLTIIGGMQVAYREHVDYREAQPDIAFMRGMEGFWTDGGAYNWALEQIKWCYKFAAKTEQRVVLRTPQLAGRIDAVGYQPLQHFRDSDPTSAYHFDGGVSVRPGMSTPYAIWSGR